MRPDDRQYFERIESRLDEAIDLAERAKGQGHDPKPEVEIPVAKDMADRVENILGIEGVAERVRELEGEMSREEAALELVTDFVEGTVGDYDSREGKVEGAVRTAVALLTEGVVAAPIEGIDRVELLENDDGTEFVNVYYAGPIRSAGGTAQALSVLVADYARSLLGIEEYNARSDETERYAEEVGLYDKETGLQYSPKDKETKFIAEHMPIMLDGEATGDEEVSGFRDLERVDTNNARGGMCLVLAEGIALKAPKIQRYTRELEEVDWPWLQDLIDGNYTDEAAVSEDVDGDGSDVGDDIDADSNGADADTGGDDAEGQENGTDESDEGDGTAAGPPRVESSKKFLRDLIAGRPVFTHPSEAGGFRLRYGRARNHGFATAGVHPATMHLVDDFLAAGTQIKTERPGKAAGVIPVDTIEGPTVRLANGDVRRIDDPEEAIEIRNGVEKILDLGEYLVNYGEFVENNHPLAPASYTVEWWIQELDAAGADVQALRDDPHVDLEEPDVTTALAWVEEYDAPLHPAFTYLWHDIDVKTFELLARVIADGEIVDGGGRDGVDSGAAAGRPRGSGDDGAGTRPDGGAASEGEPTADPSTTELGSRSTNRSGDPSASTSGRQRASGAGQQNTSGSGRQSPSGADHPNGVPAGEGTLVVERTEPVRKALETLLVEHTQTETTLRIRTWLPLALSLGLTPNREKPWSALPASARSYAGGDNAVKAVNAVAPFAVRERAPTRIGNRMGRPEKSEKRDLSPAVHTLFPIGEAGGNQRDVGGAATTRTDHGRGQLEVDLGRRACSDCGERTYKPSCPSCGSHTEPEYECESCGIEIEPDESGRVECPHCEQLVESPERQVVDLNGEYRGALDRLGERDASFDILKGVKGLTSAEKTPEPIEKGVLRAKHGVSTFKDGTVRYDMTDLPVTAVRPEELDVTAGQFRELGYETDIDGETLRHDDQLVELRVQDVVLSDGAAEHMIRTADFVDDLLVKFYDLEPFYGIDDRDDLVGELVFGMAPHTSAAVVGRVVGFTTAAVGYAHPYFHAAKRRNCFHPDTTVEYADSDGIHEESIERFVERHLDSETAETDDFGTFVQELATDVVVPSLDADGEPTRERVEAVSKHPAPEHLIRIRTRTGRELTVTPDHRMRRGAAGEERVRASRLREGDRLPVSTGSERVGGELAGGRRADGGTVVESADSDGKRGISTDNEGAIDGTVATDEIVSVEIVESDVEATYCLTVSNTHTLVAEGIYTAQCDGDEDCVMLLMDGLLNFSKQFLPDQRGGRMDAPLVMSSRIDPSEIDDEAHNMDIVERYPLEFYEATRRMADPGEVDITIAEDTLGTEDQYHGFAHTHDTSGLALGPDLSAYKTLGSMMEKMDAQLELARKLRAVDETDVAERVIEYHFLPDLIGNLRAFSRQDTRCLDCGEKYRRMPLTGECRECGGRVNLTVHQGSVNKYMDTAIEVAERFGCREYTKQRLYILERSLESVFENDQNKQSDIADFM